MKVFGFSEFVSINEMIMKQGSKWLVKNKKGTKTLGTHSSRKKAVKQLQAIEISKATHENLLLERGDREIGSYYIKTLRAAEDDEVISLITRLESLINSLETEFWYDRESRGVRYSHYALNMKIYNGPDLDKWAEAKGETEEEDINDDAIDYDWNRFMEDTYEIYSEDFKESFDWINEVGVGGKGGGWLLISPEYDHDDCERQIDSYLSSYADLISEFNFKISELLHPDFIDLSELGLVERPDNIEEILKYRLNLINELKENLQRFEEIEQDLRKIEKEIDEFKNKSDSLFYEWLKERSI